MSKIKIGCFSDSHNKHDRLEIESCDILICAGDISMMGYQWEVEDFLDWYGRQPATHKFLIAGNHDWSFLLKPEWWGRAITQNPSIIYLEDETGYYPIDEHGRVLKIYGSPWQPEFCDWAFNLPRGEKLKEKWAMIPEDTDILITHGPPYRIFDEVPPHLCEKGQDPNVGCQDLYERIEVLPNLKAHIFGHIHIDNEPEISAAYTKGLYFINASVVDNRYHLIRKKPYYFELDLP